MTLRRSSLVLLALLMGVTLISMPAASADTPSPPASRSPSKLTAEAWREDLDFLVKTMRDAHPRLYWRVGQDTLEAAVTDLARRIPTMSDDEIVVGLLRIASMPRDGHTFLQPWRGAVATGTVFPVRFYRFSDGLFVTAAPVTHAELAGARVERIGRVPADEALDRVSDLLGYDNSYTRLERAQAR